MSIDDIPSAELASALEGYSDYVPLNPVDQDLAEFDRQILRAAARILRAWPK